MSLSPKKLLSEFVQLQSDLTESGPSERWVTKRSLLVVLLNLERGKIVYHDAKATHGISSEFFEGSKPLSAKDRETVKAVYDLNRQIGKQLSALKKSK